MKLFVANLPHKLSEAELRQMLTQFGQVDSVMLKTDEEGKRKGWGFIEMPVSDQAKAAIAALNEKEVYGRKITLKEAEDRGKDSSGNFQRRGREYRGYDRDGSGGSTAISGKWGA